MLQPSTNACLLSFKEIRNKAKKYSEIDDVKTEVYSFLKVQKTFKNRTLKKGLK